MARDLTRLTMPQRRKDAKPLDMGDKMAVMRRRFEMALSAYSESRESELDDLRFMAGSPDNQYQWPDDVLALRGVANGETLAARPTLTINKLPQHVRQVTNEQRQNRPTGKVIPVDDRGDVEVAEVFEGMVRHIEYMSDADVAYDTACDNQVTYGEGYFRILTEYCDDETFDQDIRIRRIRNSFSVYMDPRIQDPCGMDAEWCFITEDMPRDDYERQFPDASPISSIMVNGTGDPSLSSWINEDTIRIAEYFYKTYDETTLNLYPGDQIAFEGTPDDRQLRQAFGAPLRSRKAQRAKVMWCKTNGYEVLEESEWAGKWIPVVRVVGNEFEIEGQVYISGLVRNAKDAQRMYNYWVSQEAEALALGTKSPYLGYSGQFEGYEEKWKTANIKNWPYLEVNAEATDADGNPLPLPQRIPPSLPQNGYIAAKMGAADDIKGTTGQYDASIGATSNERSGKAIMARQKQGDTGTYHYIDNLSRAIRFGTRQLVDLIPKIYDTQRIARIIGQDNEVEMVRIDPMQEEAVRKVTDEEGNVIAKIYNPSVGKYDVAIITGPNYATKRQEMQENMSLLLQGNPQLWPIIGDLAVKSMDWPGAQEIAERLRRMVDPKLLGDEENPEMQAAQQQMQAMAQEMEQLYGMLKSVQSSMEARELDIKSFEAEIKAYQAETQRLSAVSQGLTPEQVQDIVLGTLAGMSSMPEMEENEPEEATMQPQSAMQAPMMPQEG